MNKKLSTLLKMILLSMGLIALVSVASKSMSGNEALDDKAEATGHYFAMGTSISISIYSDDESLDKTALMENIAEDIKLLDEQLISWRSSESELGRINSMGGGSTIISTELYVVLKQSLDICRHSKGALDITIRPLATLWNIEGDSNEEFVPPTKEEIETALEQVDYESVSLLSETYNTTSSKDNSKQKDATNINYYVTFSRDDTILDLGATGKGYALDRAKAILDEKGVDGALITVGGSILVYGEKSDGKPWRIGVRDPNKPNDTTAVIGYIELPAGSKTCISTSGGYEKYKTYQGKDYHHILDSKTGYPANSGLLSVTVVCENGLASDGLSTACYVLGYEKSLPLLEIYDAQAVFMDTNGDIIVTEGLIDSWVEK